jgi:hypothetical protein
MTLLAEHATDTSRRSIQALWQSIRTAELLSHLSAWLVRAVLVVAILVVALGIASGGAAGSNQSTDLQTENGTVQLQAGPGQFVTGETELRAGSAVTVELELRLGEESFTTTQRAVVDQHGSFRAPFNLSAVPAGTDIRVVVLHDESALAVANGTIQECTAACDPAEADTVDAEFVTVGDTLELEAGPGRLVRLESTLPAGATVSLRIQSASGAATQFLMSATVITNANGTALATFDLATEKYVGSQFTITARHDDEEVAKSEGAIVACTQVCEPPEPDPPTAPTIGETVADNAVIQADEPLVIPLDLNDADVAVVQLNRYGDSESFRLNATARDGSGDGRVVVVFDPSASTEDAVLFAADQGDVVTVENQSHQSNPGRYSLRVGDADEQSERTGTIDVSDFRTFTIEPVDEGSTSTPTTTTPGSPDTASMSGIVALLLAGLLSVFSVSLLTGTVRLRR